MSERADRQHQAPVTKAPTAHPQVTEELAPQSEQTSYHGGDRRAVSVGTPPDPSSLTTSAILQLQRTMGNRAVQRLMEGSPGPKSRQNVLFKTIQREEGVITAAMGGSPYQVVAKDTLWGIAKRTYGEGRYWHDIYRANTDKVGRRGSLILVGTQLNLPRIEIPVASGDTSYTDEEWEYQQSLPEEAEMIPAAEPQPEMATTPATQSKSPSSESDDEAGNPHGAARSCLYPAFRYNLDNIPIEVAPMPIPGGIMNFSLSLRGNLTFQKNGSCLPWSIDQTGLRMEANQAAGEFTSGIRINGIGSGQMSVGTTWAGEFVSNEMRLVPPSSLVYIAMTRNLPPIALGDYTCSLNLGYEMRATFVPLPTAPRVQPDIREVPGERPWWLTPLQVAGGAALIVGAGALIAATLAEDVVTAGAGVADDPISFAAAGAMFSSGAALAF